MEFIIILIGIFLLAAFLFLLIEFPYYLVSIFAFLHLYNYNLEMPGPLDLRGLISVVLLVRLLIFDKKNLDLLRESISNKFLLIIILFSLYVLLVDLLNGASLLKTVKSFILNIVALFIGFLTIYNGFGKKSIFLAIIIAGFFAVADLLYSYVVVGTLLIKKVIDAVITGGASWETWNHNFFGGLCGSALIVTFLLLITKNVNKIIAYIFITIFSLGIVISTSRGTFISVALTLIVILFTQHHIKINFRKVLISSAVGIVFLVTVAFSYSYILSAMNLKSEFTDEIYWRLVEEPLSIFSDDYQEFGWNDNIVQGTMRWRFNKYLRDIDVFFNKNLETILFGYGTGGYREIGAIEYTGWKGETLQYSAHNFYINMISEYGVFGLIFFLSFLISLLVSVIKMVKNGWLSLSLVYMLLILFISTLSGDPNLTDSFSYILFGSVSAEYLLASSLKSQQIED